MTHVDAQSIAAEVARETEEQMHLLLDDLERWVSLSSQTYAVADVDAQARDLALTLEGYGLRCELVPSEAGLYMHAVADGDGHARVALLCHHDTVFPSELTRSWSFERRGDRVTGPGVCDMKGGIVVAAHAARQLVTHGGFGRLELVSVPDEEERDGPPVTLDRLRGFDAVLCMECGRLDGSVVSERKGGRWLRVLAEGRAAHAGVSPDAGRNAAQALCVEASRIAELHHARRGLTAQLTGLKAGDGINTVPGLASAVFDLRGLTEHDLDWAAGELASFGAHRGVRLSAKSIAVTPALERTAAVVALASEAGRVGRGIGVTVGEVATGGTSDAAWAAAAGIPTLDGLGPIGDLDHTEEEYALVSSFPSRCGIVAGLVRALDRGLAGEDRKPPAVSAGGR